MIADGFSQWIERLAGKLDDAGGLFIGICPICLDESGKLAQVKDSSGFPTGTAATIDIPGISSATIGIRRIFLFGGKNEYVCVEDTDDVPDIVLKLPEDPTLSRVLELESLDIADAENW